MTKDYKALTKDISEYVCVFRAAQTSFIRMTRLVMSQEDTKYQGNIVEIGPLFCKEDAVKIAGKTELTLSRPIPLDNIHLTLV